MRQKMSAYVDWRGFIDKTEARLAPGCAVQYKQLKFSPLALIYTPEQVPMAST